MNNPELNASPAAEPLASPETLNLTIPNPSSKAEKIWNIAFVVLLLWTMLIALAGSFFWAVTSLLHMPIWMQSILGIAELTPLAWAAILVLRMAIKSEFEPENQF